MGEALHVPHGNGLQLGVLPSTDYFLGRAYYLVDDAGNFVGAGVNPAGVSYGSRQGGRRRVARKSGGSRLIRRK
jgi:hypothetical protein